MSRIQGSFSRNLISFLLLENSHLNPVLYHGFLYLHGLAASRRLTYLLFAIDSVNQVSSYKKKLLKFGVDTCTIPSVIVV